MDMYIKGPLLGKGTFGEVIQATHKETGEVVAIKRIRVSDKGEGVNVTALREVRLLKEMDDPHILRLRQVLPHKKGLSLVFEYMESDLEKLIRDRSVILSPADVKSYMCMILKGLRACHARWVLHRDVKPDNFLIASDGRVVLADFGLARVFGSPERAYTHQVFARWYRAPELLYGARAYGPCVDVWAAGCIFAELLLRRPWFPGDSDVEVLAKIYAALGTPRPEPGALWAGLENMPAFVEFQPTRAPGLRATFLNPAAAPDDALDLLQRLVCLNPTQRLSAEQALDHRYFRVEPAPTPLHLLPKPFRQGGGDVGGRPGAGACSQAGGGGGEASAGVRASVGGEAAAGGEAATGGSAPPRQGAPPSASPATLRGEEGPGAAASGGRPLQNGGTTPVLHETPRAVDFVGLDECARPALGSSDVRFLKKRRQAFDALLEDATMS